MKKISVFSGVFFLWLFTFSCHAQDNRHFVEASTLQMIGKLLPTTNPYHRLDSACYEGFTPTELRRLRFPAGLAVTFKTNSPAIWIYTDYADPAIDPPVAISYRGYDLYIRRDGEWLFDAAKTVSIKHLNDTMLLSNHLAPGEKECLLYFPLYSELNSVKIGVHDTAYIEPLANPFTYRIGVHGSSFTQGDAASRSGMSYLSQLERMTGLQMLNFGVGGRAKLQPYFADALCDAKVDAWLFDLFSNPWATEIETKLFPFIEKLQAAHPDIPLIFQSTIYREARNFDICVESFEADKIRMADSLMAIAVKRYKNVYYIKPNATDKSHSTSADGVHPNDYGYTLWAESIRKPLLKILGKYGIK